MAVIIAYKVLRAATIEELEAAVKEAIGKGWQPVGGVAAAGATFYQAMAGH